MTPPPILPIGPMGGLKTALLMGAADPDQLLLNEAPPLFSDLVIAIDDDEAHRSDWPPALPFHALPPDMAPLLIMLAPPAEYFDPPALEADATPDEPLCHESEPLSL